jgi:hypothetical protein
VVTVDQTRGNDQVELAVKFFGEVGCIVQVDDVQLIIDLLLGSNGHHVLAEIHADNISESFIMECFTDQSRSTSQIKDS